MSKAKKFIPPYMHENMTNAPNRKLVNAALNLTYPFCSPPPFGKAITDFLEHAIISPYKCKKCDHDCYDAAQDPSSMYSLVPNKRHAELVDN